MSQFVGIQPTSKATLLLLLWAFVGAHCLTGLEVSEFLIFTPNTIGVVNSRRHIHDHVMMNISFPGTEIHSTTLSKDKITLELTDKTNVTFTKIQFDGNFVQHSFTWENAGPREDGTNREVCFHYGSPNTSWYSTSEEFKQVWPMDTRSTFDKPRSFTTSDFFQTHSLGSFVEYIFLNTDGFAINVGKPLLHMRRDFNEDNSLLCFSMIPQNPYTEINGSKRILEIDILAAKNIKVAYEHISDYYIPKPDTIPDEKMFTYPIWSTWAKFKKDINQAKVLEFAQDIKKHNFSNSQIEIDDLWEKHYGDFSFDPAKFPDVKNMTTELHKLGYRVTLWAYPFVNFESEAHDKNKQYFVKNLKNDTLQVNWWDGKGAAVDFSNEKAAQWFVERLEHIRNETGIDSFKFDAGELNWYGHDFSFSTEAIQTNPNLITKAYVETCAKLGNMIEVRSAYRTQHLPIFVRMLDKSSDWTYNDGLKSLIPTALTMSIAGYSFIMPDMIGGNAYGNKPSEELFIRWLQINVFMPNMQFSIAPWEYSQKTVDISRKMVDLHVQYSPKIIELAKKIKNNGPVLRPMWMQEPDDPKTFKIDNQFMVGEDIVVAPVVEQGKQERVVYLPSGNWVDQHGKNFTGPIEISVSAPLEVLPYFLRKQ